MIDPVEIGSLCQLLSFSSQLYTSLYAVLFDAGTGLCGFRFFFTVGLYQALPVGDPKAPSRTGDPLLPAGCS